MDRFFTVDIHYSCKGVYGAVHTGTNSKDVKANDDVIARDKAIKLFKKQLTEKEVKELKVFYCETKQIFELA